MRSANLNPFEIIALALCEFLAGQLRGGEKGVWGKKGENIMFDLCDLTLYDFLFSVTIT
jgi:hypothetical protein